MRRLLIAEVTMPTEGGDVVRDPTPRSVRESGPTLVPVSDDPLDVRAIFSEDYDPNACPWTDEDEWDDEDEDSSQRRLRAKRIREARTR